MTPKALRAFNKAAIWSGLGDSGCVVGYPDAGLRERLYRLNFRMRRNPRQTVHLIFGARTRQIPEYQE